MTPKKLVIDAQDFIGGTQTSQLIDIVINGVPQAQVILNKRFGNQFEVPLTSSMMNAGKLKLELQFPTAISPKALGIDIDERPLAIGLEAVRYE